MRGAGRCRAVIVASMIDGDQQHFAIAHALRVTADRRARDLLRIVERDHRDACSLTET